MRVRGIVQGVGFRPHVHRLATAMRLAGHVGNDARGVVIEIEGPEPVVDRFMTDLVATAPPLAVIEDVSAAALEPRGGSGFVIAGSAAGGPRRTLIAPDTATCDACLAELDDPDDRRYRYPFINCTNCGPRFTIVTGLPYDRPSTTMARFTMCAECAGEYHDPGDRRFHAQPVCCPACGPTVSLVDRAGVPLPCADHGGDPILAAAGLLRAGGVLAVKGLGGYHLAADAGGAGAVSALRARKHREDKPFAVMAADLDGARTLGVVGPVETALLTGPRRPIVLLKRQATAPVAPAVAPGNPELGVMLPYTPLHRLLLGAAGAPLVLTSGNVSDEPIAYRDEEARQRLGTIADAFLVHDRPIHTRTDDSVVRVFRGAALPLRRSRGYVPQPLTLPRPCRRPVLACGAELKNTFCLAGGRRAFVSHHIGDLENYETLRSFTEGIAHFRRMFDLTPEVVAFDLHPEYLSTKYAQQLQDVDLVGVQHHHAHIASCLADNQAGGPVIGVAFDGTGYGPDGTLWGGEFLLADLSGYRRLGHLETVPMPGGVTAIRQPWRMAVAFLELIGEADSGDLGVARRNVEQWEAVRAVARAGVHTPATPTTSSAGRLFDAVAALAGVRDTITFEGQAAIGLEHVAGPGDGRAYPVRLSDGDPFQVRSGDLVRGVVDDLRAGTPVPLVAARFHDGLAMAIVAGCQRARALRGLGTVALSGGVFQNMRLARAVVDALEQRRFTVLSHCQVPPNDGGISLGQAAVAAAADRAAG